MRKRTFLDRKFSQGDSNSDLYRDNWERTFGEENKPATGTDEKSVSGSAEQAPADGG